LKTIIDALSAPHDVLVQYMPSPLRSMYFPVGVLDPPSVAPKLPIVFAVYAPTGSPIVFLDGKS
jgi:hypothetical protein